VQANLKWTKAGAMKVRNLIAEFALFWIVGLLSGVGDELWRRFIVFVGWDRADITWRAVFCNFLGDGHFGQKATLS